MVLALLLLLLLLLRDCSCAEPVVEPPAEGAIGIAGPPVELAPVPEPPAGRVERRDRPEYATAPPEPLPWLASFRMQVGARGPRLAECFVGAERPGALKWTTSVEPSSGRVSDHTLEPTIGRDPLTTEQRACVLGVLTSPPYQLEAGAEDATPTRVGMAIEF